MYTALQLANDGHWPGPWILLVPLFWVAVILLVVVTLRRTAWRHRWAADNSPLAELGRRYARGEIDAEEYRARRAVLTEEGVPAKKNRGGAK